MEELSFLSGLIWTTSPLPAESHSPNGSSFIALLLVCLEANFLRLSFCSFISPFLHPASSPASQGSCYIAASFLSGLWPLSLIRLHERSCRDSEVCSLGLRFPWSNGAGLRGMNALGSPMAGAITYTLPLFLPNISVPPVMTSTCGLY